MIMQKKLVNHSASIIALRDKGYSAREIAKRLGLGKTSVAKYLARNEESIIADAKEPTQKQKQTALPPQHDSPAPIAPRVKVRDLPKIAFNREDALDKLEEATIKRLTDLVPAAPINTIPYLSNLLNVLQQRHLQQQPKTDIQINSITLALQQIRDSQITLCADSADSADTQAK